MIEKVQGILKILIYEEFNGIAWWHWQSVGIVVNG